jgi:hypothetical protein
MAIHAAGTMFLNEKAKLTPLVDSQVSNIRNHTTSLEFWLTWRPLDGGAKMPIHAAQYLRMSTEHQQYSLVNQAAKIQDYSEEHEFLVVKTYADAGRSGILLKSRTGLTTLLADVMSGRAEFKVILVYDVSRWGRFQDADEAAH